ncbi:uncharacterized protein BDV14DRAFT_201730 [Aspergillus stella-maris]|uniref:uncharacterized protein n=1 Tax=Aspergillus stella-maris TaxID=1810926 RepID=UPI003CCD9EDF
MNFPPEIRNQIYGYLFLPQRVEMKRIKASTTTTKPTKDKNKSKTIKHDYHRLVSRLLAPRDLKTQILLGPARDRKTQTQLNLPFVCKQSYNDTLCLLYACTQFKFTSPKCVSRFLWKTPVPALAAVNHIELVHTMYNEPTLTKFRDIKLRADKGWYELCERISLTLKALEVVHVNMAIHSGPIELEVGESWSQPILALGRGKVNGGTGGALRFVRVILRSDRVEAQKLFDVGKELERELMNPVAMQIREDERLAREMQGLQKAREGLRLTFE